MVTQRIVLASVAALLMSAVPQDASAQLNRYLNQANRIINSAQNNNRNYNNNHNHGTPYQNNGSQYSPGYHVDHHDHVVRDSHGHVIGNYHHDVIHQNSRYIIPHTSHSNQHGSYFVRDNGYYYAPQTASISSQVAPVPVQVQFGSFSHVDDLASRLEDLCNEFCLDLHYNYSHNHGYSETYAEAYQILQVAKYIHDAEHANDRAAIRSQLNGVDSLFHHVQDDVRGWSRHHRQQVGQLGILSKMDMIESTLHHLMNDVGVQQAPPPGAHGEAPAPGFPAPGPLTVAPPPSTLP